ASVMRLFCSGSVCPVLYTLSLHDALPISSRKTALTVTVQPAGMESAPLPEIVPPLHVMEVPVRLIGAVPLNVPPLIVSVCTVNRSEEHTSELQSRRETVWLLPLDKRDVDV